MEYSNLTLIELCDKYSSLINLMDLYMDCCMDDQPIYDEVLKDFEKVKEEINLRDKKENKMAGMWIRYYEGFEAIDTLLKGEDIEDFLDYCIGEDEGADWGGTLKITVEYFPDNTEDA